MNEKHWLETDARAMADYLLATGSERKLRLLACARAEVLAGHALRRTTGRRGR